MSFSKILHGIQNGNEVTLTQLGLIYLNFVRQGKAPEEILQNVAGSLGHVTASLGTMCVGFL